MFSASIVDAAWFEVVDARSLVPVVAATPNPVVDTGSKGDAVRLKKESYRTMLACGTPGAVDRYRQAKPSKRLQPGRSWRQKLRVWEEFGEAMEEDYRSASKRFWQTVRRLRRGKQYSANTVYSAGGPESVFQLQGDHTSQPPGKVYARVLERRIRPIVDPRIQEEQCGFRPGRGTLDQLYTLHRVLEGLWEFASTSSPHVLCGSGEGIRPCPSWYSVGGAPRVWGPGAFAKGCSVSVRPEQELGSHCRHGWDENQHTSKSEAMVLDRKRVACPLQVGGEVLPQVEEFKYLGVLFTSEGKMEREIEIDRRIGAASAVMRKSVYRTVVVKKELSRKAKLLIYRSIYVPTLTYGHELWVMTERTRSCGYKRPK
ncbi:hypothetical protein L3Q82_019953 [Scortum barcoo]|uniref:Uncharacterized protein n=1 Tax=Scortum barcoo TaxID=214431 RepID=A0ACB8VCT0_9TELE|nr:hypothetical protein L3Q82_019953 [Scortum barcoo]